MEQKVFEHYFSEETLKCPLDDLATCFKGRNLAAKETSGTIAMVNLADLDQFGQITYDQLRWLATDQIDSKHFLQTGDVLVATKGTVKKVAVFDEQAFPIIASANFSVLRPGSDLHPYYLKLFLDSPLGHYLLDEADRGRAVMNISRKNLMSIYIPKLPLIKQNYLAQSYRQGLHDYQRKLYRAEQEWENRQEQLEKNLLG